MTDPKKPPSSDIDSLKSKLGLPGSGDEKDQATGAPAQSGGIAPPVFAPPGQASPVVPGIGAQGSSPVAPPAFGGSSSPIPPPAGITPPSASPDAGVGNVAPPAVDIAPPSFAPAGSGAVPPPSFSPSPVADVAPPPFGAQEEEEEVIREEVVKKIVQDGTAFDDKEVGRVSFAPFVAVGATIAAALLFGYLAGTQIDRPVLTNRSIDAAITIHTAVMNDQVTVKNLRSRIKGAISKGMSETDPGADFVLLDYLAKIRNERPFSARIWAGEFYQPFKSKQMIFEYYRSVHELWDIVGDVASRWEDTKRREYLKAWPAKRQEVLEIMSAKGASGYGLAFKKVKGKVHARAGMFKNSRAESEKGNLVYRADWTPLGGGSPKALTDYQPSFEPLSENPTEYFVRVFPDSVVGKQRKMIRPGGPFVSEYQTHYLRYLGDLDKLNKSITVVQTNQDNLVQALADIRQVPHRFTFGF